MMKTIQQSMGYSFPVTKLNNGKLGRTGMDLWKQTEPWQKGNSMLLDIAGLFQKEFHDGTKRILLWIGYLCRYAEKIKEKDDELIGDYFRDKMKQKMEEKDYELALQRYIRSHVAQEKMREMFLKLFLHPSVDHEYYIVGIDAGNESLIERGHVVANYSIQKGRLDHQERSFRMLILNVNLDQWERNRKYQRVVTKVDELKSAQHERTELFQMIRDALDMVGCDFLLTYHPLPDQLLSIVNVETIIQIHSIKALELSSRHGQIPVIHSMEDLIDGIHECGNVNLVGRDLTKTRPYIFMPFANCSTLVFRSYFRINVEFWIKNWMKVLYFQKKIHDMYKIKEDKYPLIHGSTKQILGELLRLPLGSGLQNAINDWIQEEKDIGDYWDNAELWERIFQVGYFIVKHHDVEELFAKD